MSHITSFVVLLLLGLYGSASAGRLNGRFPSAASAFFGGGVEVEDDEEVTGTRWAVLIAGPNGYRNYRHQADVCHAYQMLSKGGLKDENIVVFMYDDIANDELNPRPGVIINRPDGVDVYKGVPKDYTGGNVTVNNFFAAILANRSALTGGSGKVVDSGPDDHIFIYYTDHGGPGLLGMPTEFLYAKDLIEVLGKKHASGTYKSMVFYLEACESGSIFDGLLPESWNIYATTAANPNESSWGTYCPGKVPSPPPEYDTCLGDLYSVAWLEDCDAHDLRNETLEQQYERVRTNSIVVGRLTPFKLPSDDYRRAWNEVLWVCRTKSNDYGGARNVKQRTINNNYTEGSHVMQYGDIAFSNSTLVQYMGANDTDTFEDERFSEPPVNSGVEQRDADLVHFWHKFLNAPEGSPRKAEARKQYLEAISLRKRIDEKVKLTGKLLFGLQKGPEVLNRVRPAGQPVVDDWDCLKTLVNTFETQCEPLTQYGMKHARAFANICNAGITQEQITGVFTQACGGVPIAH